MFDQFVRHRCWISLLYRQTKMEKQELWSLSFIALQGWKQNCEWPPGSRKPLQTRCVSHQCVPESCDPVPAGVKELLAGVHYHTGYKLLSSLLHWLRQAEIYQGNTSDVLFFWQPCRSWSQKLVSLLTVQGLSQYTLFPSVVTGYEFTNSKSCTSMLKKTVA